MTVNTTREPSFFRSFLFGGMAHLLEVGSGGHILDRIKVHCEKQGTTASIMKNARDIFAQGGVKAFYKGLRWNLFLSAFKGSHGWVINNLSNRFVSLFIKESERKSLLYPASVSLVTAAIEGTFVITPVERMKTIEMTSEKSVLSTLTYFKKHGLPFFFVGLPSVVFRQSVTWTSYLCFYDRYKAMVENYKSFQCISLVDKIGVAALTGASVCLVNSPIDFYKTHKQMLDSLPEKNPLENIKHLISKYGVTAFYSNLKIKVLRSSFSCVVIISTLDYTNTLPMNMRMGECKPTY